MIKNYNSFLESIFWYKSGKLVPDNDFKIPENKYIQAEQWFLEQITNLEEVRKDKCSDSIFYKKNGLILFEYNENNKYFRCDIDEIWLVLLKHYKLSHDEIRQLIKNMINEHLNLKTISIGPWKMSIRFQHAEQR